MSPRPSLVRGLRTVTFASLTILNCFSISFIGFCLVPILFVSPARYRRLFDNVSRLWLWMAAGLLDTLVGLEVAVIGDEIRSTEPCIIVMNHRTRLDWLYFWAVLARQPSGLIDEKILLKSSLKGIPGPGWVMQAAGCLFVKRSWEEDKRYLKTMLDYFRSVGCLPHILMFPEGTDYTDETLAKSDAYAKSHGLRSYRHVLQPRTTGFAFMTSYARENWPTAAIYDVTVGYQGSFSQTEPEFVRGNLPESAHFYVKRYSVTSDLPSSTSDLELWLRSRWDEKDDRLANFYREGGRFVGEQREVPEWIGAYYRVAFAFWLVFASAMLFLTILSSFVRWMLVAAVVFYVTVNIVWGGFELFQAKYALHVL